MAGEVDTLARDLRTAGPARVAAAERLAQLGEEARPAAAELVAATSDDAAREWAVAALESLGPPPKEQEPQLVALADSKVAITAYWAVTLLGRLEEAARSATPKLAAVLEKSPHVEVRQRAAWALGQIGAKDASTQQALTVAATSSDARLARIARQTLDTIAAK